MTGRYIARRQPGCVCKARHPLNRKYGPSSARSGHLDQAEKTSASRVCAVGNGCNVSQAISRKLLHICSMTSRANYNSKEHQLTHRLRFSYTDMENLICSLTPTASKLCRPALPIPTRASLSAIRYQESKERNGYDNVKHLQVGLTTKRMQATKLPIYMS